MRNRYSVFCGFTCFIIVVRKVDIAVFFFPLMKRSVNCILSYSRYINLFHFNIYVSTSRLKIAFLQDIVPIRTYFLSYRLNSLNKIFSVAFKTWVYRGSPHVYSESCTLPGCSRSAEVSSKSVLSLEWLMNSFPKESSGMSTGAHHSVAYYSWLLLMHKEMIAARLFTTFTSELRAVFVLVIT